MEADVSSHKAVHKGHQRNLDVGPQAEAASKGQEERDIPSVDGGVRQSHHLIFGGEYIILDCSSDTERLPKGIPREHSR